MVGARVQRVASLGMLVCLLGGVRLPLSAQGRPVGGPPTGNGPRITTTNTPDHPSPPQPQQRQGLDYFAGTWTFAWTGRENPISLGPRSGTAVFTPSPDGRTLTQATTGATDEGARFEESASLQWDAATRLLRVQERTAGGVDITAVGDWSSPLAVRFEVQPVQAGGRSVRLRRTYAILSDRSFTATEELSDNGGPFVRLGSATFDKTR